jgi:hypothetical protein
MTKIKLKNDKNCLTLLEARAQIKVSGGLIPCEAYEEELFHTSHSFWWFAGSL